MPPTKTAKPPTENLPYAAAFSQWMASMSYDTANLAKALRVSPRTVDRWKSGEAVPDMRVRAVLVGLGAPPLDRAKKGPGASVRIERLLLEIVGRLDRIEKRLSQVD